VVADVPIRNFLSMPISRPAGRPREFNVDAALDTLLSLFWTRGYEATSLLDMVDATGLSKSSLRAAFGSKDGIYAAAMTRYDEQVATVVIDTLRSGSAGLDDLHALVDMQSRIFRSSLGSNGCAATNTAAELGRGHPGAVQMHAQFRRRLREAFIATLERAVARGEIDDAATAERAELLITLFFGSAVLTRAGASRAEQSVRNAAIHTLIESFRCPPIPRGERH
jgi:AcrR family transcriptional regulator